MAPFPDYLLVDNTRHCYHRRYLQGAETCLCNDMGMLTSRKQLEISRRVTRDSSLSGWTAEPCRTPQRNQEVSSLLTLDWQLYITLDPDLNFTASLFLIRKMQALRSAWEARLARCLKVEISVGLRFMCMPCRKPNKALIGGIARKSPAFKEFESHYLLILSSSYLVLCAGSGPLTVRDIDDKAHLVVTSLDRGVLRIRYAHTKKVISRCLAHSTHSTNVSYYLSCCCCYLIESLVQNRHSRYI